MDDVEEFNNLLQFSNKFFFLAIKIQSYLNYWNLYNSIEMLMDFLDYQDRKIEKHLNIMFD